MSNAIAQRPSFSAMIATPAYQKTIANTLQDPRQAKRFCSAIISAVAVSPLLQECDPPTILSGALLGEALNLSPSPQLGHYYLVPFWNKKKGANDAVFVLGYKGMIQLALRSGQYKKLNVYSVKEGELKHWDPITEDIELDVIQDEETREKAATVGYVAMFEYMNGFRKVIYWTRSKMERHALRYSKGYAAKKGYTFWEKDFDAMAYKTLLRQLISKWGIMSIDMQEAYEADHDLESLDPEEVTEQVEETAVPPEHMRSTNPNPEVVAESAVDAEPESLSLDDL